MNILEEDNILGIYSPMDVVGKETVFSRRDDGKEMEDVRSRKGVISSTIRGPELVVSGIEHGKYKRDKNICSSKKICYDAGVDDSSRGI